MLYNQCWKKNKNKNTGLKDEDGFLQLGKWKIERKN